MNKINKRGYNKKKDKDLPDGLYYVENYLKENEINWLLKQLNKKKTQEKFEGVTLAENSRKVLQFGYSYGYGGTGVKKIKDIPKNLLKIVDPKRINKAIRKKLV